MKGQRYKTQSISQMLSRCKTSSASIDNPETKTATKISSGDSVEVSLSRFNLINWKKQRYLPSENEKRLKFQNDASLHMIVNEIPKHKCKSGNHSQSAHRQIQAIFQRNYRQHYEEIKDSLTSSKLQENDMQQVECQEQSLVSVFKQNHQRLCSYVCDNFRDTSKQNSKDRHQSDGSVRKFVLPVVKQPKQTNKLIYVRTQNVIKTSNPQINGRIQRILNKWKGSKKLINERFHQIWKPPQNNKKQSLNYRTNTTQINNLASQTVATAEVEGRNPLQHSESALPENMDQSKLQSDQ